jgi:hypothetical protein
MFLLTRQAEFTVFFFTYNCEKAYVARKAAGVQTVFQDLCANSVTVPDAPEELQAGVSL